ncbi:MAG: hypothetical protein JXQ71_11690 [Verrucomicrobia bacterium]|nr:hypothetical protein [Verrucomicrobiota bacterium]
MKPPTFTAARLRRRSRIVAGELLLLWATTFAPGLRAAYAGRFVWVFGWGLGRDSDVTEITGLLERAAQHGINGAVASLGLDTLSQQGADYFRRLEAVQQACERHHIELIPAIFSIGYGGGILSRDQNLAEGLPVVNAPFVVHGDAARFEPDASVRLVNGDFEEFTGNRFPGFGFHDQPGEIRFADTQVKHGGRAAMRLENFTANPHGHGRVNQEVRVQPHRCYRVSVWVKTESLEPASGFQMLTLAGDRDIAPRQFNLPATADWRKLTLLFNSLHFHKVRLAEQGGKSEAEQPVRPATASRPAHTPRNHRLHSQHHIERLTLLRDVTRAGHHIGQMARLSNGKLRASSDWLKLFVAGAWHAPAGSRPSSESAKAPARPK